MNRFQTATEYTHVTAFWRASGDAVLSYILNLSILSAVQRQKLSSQTLHKGNVYEPRGFNSGQFIQKSELEGMKKYFLMLLGMGFEIKCCIKYRKFEGKKEWHDIHIGGII